MLIRHWSECFFPPNNFQTDPESRLFSPDAKSLGRWPQRSGFCEETPHQKQKSVDGLPGPAGTPGARGTCGTCGTCGTRSVAWQHGGCNVDGLVAKKPLGSLGCAMVQT